MGIVKAICISERKGTRKRAVPSALFVREHGLDRDAHAGPGHRQVSLLPHESVEKFQKRGFAVSPGDFGENLVVSGLDAARLQPGARLAMGNVLLEITQIGKECHGHCAIFRAMGECIMPSQGVFARVLRGGRAAAGGVIIILPPAGPEEQSQ